MCTCPLVATAEEDALKSHHKASCKIEPNYKEEMEEIRKLYRTDIRQIAAAKVWMLVTGFFPCHDKEYLNRLTMAIQKQVIEHVISLQ